MTGIALLDSAHDALQHQTAPLRKFLRRCSRKLSKKHQRNNHVRRASGNTQFSERDKDKDVQKFVVLCWRRTGSNWLCGMLFNHPEIFMHNEIFNEHAIHTYYPKTLRDWDYRKRDTFPADFLEAVYESHLQHDDDRKCQRVHAVGYKSFHDHYLENNLPHESLYDVYEEMMSDTDVKKIILYRENVFAVYLSMRRSFMTGSYVTTNYSNMQMHISVPDCQAFFKLYNNAYRFYKEKTRGQKCFSLTYEDMISSDETKNTRLNGLLSFLNLDDITPPSSQPETIPQSTTSLQNSISNYDEVEYAWRHTEIGKKFLPPREESMKVKVSPLVDNCSPAVETNEELFALLLPIRSFSLPLVQCHERLSQMKKHLDQSTSSTDRNSIVLVIGLDDDDDVYNTEPGKEMLTNLFCSDSQHKYEIMIEVLGNVRGKICRIWNHLARKAYHRGADFLLLFGDDVYIETNNWKTTVHDEFQTLSEESGLPFGCACVAFIDRAFLGFPTFPVIHRSHLERFDMNVVPSTFVNQGGDPYVFELYNRFGTARFAHELYLTNSIGGKDVARYLKQTIRWNTSILSGGITALKSSLGTHAVKMYTTIDVVVPTYRCDIAVLKKIVQLRCKWPYIRVKFWLIIDNPTSPLVPSVQMLSQNFNNYSVNVRLHKDNFGASAARNTGLDYSNADWAILLDDDVTVEDDLLDAYVGAIMRYPQAHIFVGNTQFPKPHNLITHSIIACGLNGSFGISERCEDPAWGPTANLCVRGRTSTTRFGLQYPKTGGGEDIDYCFKVSKQYPKSIVSVPGALAHHPWWSEGKAESLWHFFGWALGESMCIESISMQRHVYFSCPNGVETLFLVIPFLFCYVIYVIYVILVTNVSSCGSEVNNIVDAAAHTCLGEYSSIEPLREAFKWYIITAVIILCTEVIWHTGDTYKRVHHSLKSPQMYVNYSYKRYVVSVCAALLIMFQDCSRFSAHCRRGTVTNICWRIDWLGGQSADYVLYNKRRLFLKFSFYVFIACFCYFHICLS